MSGGRYTHNGVIWRLRKWCAAGSQNWMALDLWMALGRDSARAPSEPFAAWAEMLAEVRSAGSVGQGEQEHAETPERP